MPWPRPSAGSDKLAPRSAADVRHASSAVVAFSDDMQRELDRLRAFLFARVYRHPRIAAIMGEAEGVVGDLFARYSVDPEALPPDWRGQAPPRGTPAYARHISRLHRRHDRPLRPGRASPPV